MFDPTIFENLKVGIENHVYDLDNLDGTILVNGRTDLLDMAVMSRSFTLSFELTHSNKAAAEINLHAGVRDLADEILETPEQQPGCDLTIRFHKEITDAASDCPQIQAILERVWEPQLPPMQTVRYIYDQVPAKFHCTAELKFPRKINEEQMEDLPNLIDHILRSLEQLNQW
ncbi:hypothetical protein JCM10914A_08400 [Paenibacillus sp. JCM 10914]|uniref:hypothetical protein n=1 Tax=Paenibacillus sp. JCM 10914 TaxID=1236974 RepID=UPI0003CCB663|nr:hypothetical protein [Paenibacillus sp. JCM 10914]GAE05644.1 Bacillus cereus group-specific protein, uncharacterized [Paenibacillus sp. JCM 10914]